MALTAPFINTMPAFDATIGITININILGGDAISGYQFLLLENNGTEVPFYSSPIFQPSNDIAGVSIRSYAITIPANISGNNEFGQKVIVSNNNQYRIQAKTYNASGESIIGNDTIFYCYKTPATKLQVLKSEEVSADYFDLKNGETIPSSQPSLKFTFSPNDLLSIAEPNILTVSLYGMKNGHKTYISTSGEIYNFEYDLINNVEYYTTQFKLSGFSINVNIDGNGIITPKSDSAYDSYIIEYSIRTIENMVVEETFTDLNCYYVAIQNSPFLTANNLCDKGVISLTCSGLTSFNGTSNPTPPMYINNEEIDLTATSSWAKWENLFSLNQPYTLGLWARNIKKGVVVSMTTSGYIYKYIKLKYNIETSNEGIYYSFISLESGRNDNYGNTMFPYYIESEHIQTSLINEDTKLFIGLQQQGDLFDIHLEIIN